MLIQKEREKFKIEKEFFQAISSVMVHALIKFKLLKLALFTAFGAGVIATLLAQEVHKKKKTEDLDG